MKKILKILLIIILVVILAAGAYVAYVFASFHRIGDMELKVENPVADKAQVGQEYDITTWNIGFGAYTADFDFFMDGGTHSWAVSEEALDENMKNIASTVNGFKSDFYLFEEVDFDSTRTYHMDERTYLTDVLKRYNYTWAQNYDSPFLFYPFTEPHGASKSCIMTFSKYNISAANRVGLPIDEGMTKFLDLDRCYSVSRVPLKDKKGNEENAPELVIYTLHLSAYSADGSIATEQLNLLIADMQKEYEKGNYCIAGGDFNKDLLGDSSKYFGIPNDGYTWAQPIPDGTFDDVNLKLMAPEPDNPSCRNCDAPYNPEQFVITVDGFIVSDNITVDSCKVLFNDFIYSDHCPVKMHFKLN